MIKSHSQHLWDIMENLARDLGDREDDACTSRLPSSKSAHPYTLLWNDPVQYATMNRAD